MNALSSLLTSKLFTGCSGTVRHQRFSFRILIGFFLLGAMVLVNCYSGIVISSLTVPKMKASIDSLEDLANSQEVDVLLRSDVSTGEQILVIHFAYSFVLSI